MENSENRSPKSSAESSDTYKLRNRAKKRKREDSGSGEDDILPENVLEVEKSIHYLAAKNNLDDVSVKKILKKVVTNDHVLALVKLREEEEQSVAKDDVAPKITRAKAKELMKASPQSAPWNLELTPIKHIPVKTRPEVKALIAQELPEDEDDDEYEPTNDDVPSDDDHATCSDIDSLPPTPVTPRSQTKSSPQVVTDGPFKVPQETVSQAKRQLQLEEEATIALRTRSKLSLSETPIEHIESSFVPPDDIPLQDVDDLWSEFLKECLDPASNTRHEDDDETDPEYNVAADPDAVEEDEESLESSLIKISKKELSDLVTELFNVMPEPQLTPELNNVNKENETESMTNSQWEGKQEPLSDEERKSSSACLVFEKNDTFRISIGKSEPDDDYEENEQPVENTEAAENRADTQPGPPPVLKEILTAPPPTITVHVDENVITQQQILILQQQLRMHIQISTSNYLQLFVSPIHWSYAPQYKEYVETLHNIVEENEKSVANVCNLKPAYELMLSWEDTVSQDTPENKKMVQFIQEEADKRRRRGIGSKSDTLGDFPLQYKEVVANSSVFLYPFLLPATPYRGDQLRRRAAYLPSEDHLIVLGLDQFWDYVEANPDIFPKPNLINNRHRWGLNVTIDLICKHMLPWFTPKILAGHIATVRKSNNKNHIINKFFRERIVEPTKHVIYPFNPEITLYEQPEEEMPRIWVRYLAKSSKRFRTFMLKKRIPSLQPPAGVEVIPGQNVTETTKAPLPINFVENFNCNRINCHSVEKPPPDKFDVNITEPLLRKSTTYEVVQTETGTILKPLNDTVEEETEIEEKPPEVVTDPNGHCSCCDLLRKICKYRQKRITEYIQQFKVKTSCPCRSVNHPKITNRLKILLSYYNSEMKNMFNDLYERIEEMKKTNIKFSAMKESDEEEKEARDQAFVARFQMRLMMRENKVRNQLIKRYLFTILSRFKPEVGDPVKLMDEIYKACGVDMADMYKEFLAFLNPEQADKIDQFRDYFIHNCIEDLVRKTEEIVTDKFKKSRIYVYLRRLSRSNPASCVMCTELLYRMRDYPQLARYCFSLFPHRKKVRQILSTCDANTQINPNTSIVPPKATVPVIQLPVPILPSLEENQDKNKIEEKNYSTEKITFTGSESSDDEFFPNSMKLKIVGNQICIDHRENGNESMETTETEIKQEVDDDTEIEGRLTICEEQNSDCINISSDDNLEDDKENKLNIQQGISKIVLEEIYMPKDEPLEPQIKQDPLNTSDNEEIKMEWKRDEDKLILEVLQQYLSPEERKDKTIVEIIEEKNIPQKILNTLQHRSVIEVKKRMYYLLQILVQSE